MLMIVEGVAVEFTARYFGERTHVRFTNAR
jgi:hypothetical protein